MLGQVEATMDAGRVELVMQYALAASRCEHDDDWGLRDLGPIHLIKYVYLADLAYAEEHGASFTGAEWQFHHFGPWCKDVWCRIPHAMGCDGAERRVVPSRFDTDCERWSMRNVDDARALRERLRQRLPLRAALAVDRSAKRYGNATTELLHHVYTTGPMLRARPGEALRFDRATPSEPPTSEVAVQPTKRAARELASARRRVAERAAQVREARQRALAAYCPPAYDDVYQEALRVLDEAAGPPPPENGTLEFGPGVWDGREAVFLGHQ